MRNLVVDLGNSRIKVGEFTEVGLVNSHSFNQVIDLLPLIQQPHHNIIVSSVSANAVSILNQSVASGKKIQLTPQTLLPIKNRYETPHTLGVDRVAAVCGAVELFPDEDCLVVDLGTCINYELIDRERVYHGGIISPGLTMRFQAMNTFTARLPLVEPIESAMLIGNSTTSCMQSGVFNGMLEEMKGIINRLKLNYPDLRVILTGGNAPFFENQLKPHIFAAPELVLTGLNRILTHNASI